MDIQTSNYYC
nr:truncated Imm [Mycoplasma phage MAV1] [Metamycoplasma arthritidis]